MPKKADKTNPNPINRVIADNTKSKQSKQQIDKEYYQKNKEKKKQQQKERYQQDKERIKTRKRKNYAKRKAKELLSIKQQRTKYYQAENIQVLITLKEYTKLSKDKQKLFKDFSWTLKDCSEGVYDIVNIMKLAQVANKLIKDYWDTAKSKEKQDKSVWNLLDYDQQQRVIKYWGREKARVENNYIDEAERLEKQGNGYLKEIELAKYHEERGKKGCECYACEEQKKIRSEVEAEREKIIDDYEAEQKKSGELKGGTEWVKADCYNCGEYKKVDSNSGMCKKCAKEYE